MEARTGNAPPSRLPPLAGLNPWAVAAGLSPAQVEAALARGRVARAEVATDLSLRLGAAVGRGLRAAARALGRAASAWAEHHRRHAARAVLLRMDRHRLADIGIRRDQVRAAVDGLLSVPETATARPRVAPPAPRDDASQRLAA